MFSVAREEYPDPKSSTSNGKPLSWNLSASPLILSLSIAALSVISIGTRWVFTPISSAICWYRLTTLSKYRLALDRLMDTGIISFPCFCHSNCCIHTFRKTYSSRTFISPSLSNNGMNLPGGITFPFSSLQRIRPSAPTIRSVSGSYFGWYHTSKQLFSRECLNSSSMALSSSMRIVSSWL